jgi:CubicO group peptidase (beta-lactamase class C family)
MAGVALSAGWSPRRWLFAQAAAPPLPEKGIELLRQYLKDYSVPGMELTYARGSRILYRGCFGEAGREAHQAVKSDTLFRIASCSKAFTSAAIFLLVEAGKLELTARVFAPDGLLPRFADLGENREWLHQITVHQLLTHTGGGWGNDRNDPMFEKPGLSHEELIVWTLKTHALQNPPGEKYAYSNFGYCVLGRVIEQVSGICARESPAARAN